MRSVGLGKEEVAKKAAGNGMTLDERLTEKAKPKEGKPGKGGGKEADKEA